jgi:hydroxymethylbilane synthase
VLDGDQLDLRGFVAAVDGSRLLRDQVRGAATDADRLGRELAERLLAQGAADILGVRDASR